MLRSAFLDVSSEQARVLSSSKYLCLINFKFARFLAAGNPITNRTNILSEFF